MKSLRIHLGGHPLVKEDYEWLQSSLMEGIMAVAGLHEQPLVALNGVEITIGGGNITWTAGWLVINGELCRVDGGTTTSATNTTFVIEETIEPTGDDVEYEDLSLEDIYIVRKAKISGNAGGTNHIDNIKRMHLTALEKPKLISAIPSLTWTASGAPTVASYRINQIKEVLLSGVVSTLSWSAGQTVLFTLPAGYRPAEQNSLPIVGLVNGTMTILVIEILANGDVQIQNGIVASDAVIISLYGLRFQIAGI